MVVEEGKKVEHKLTPADIRARLEKIPNEDLVSPWDQPEVARPEWTILTVLPVPPVTMRPSIILENGQRSEDDLTHKPWTLSVSTRGSKRTRMPGHPNLIIEDLWELLHNHVTTYLDNEVAGARRPATAAEGRSRPFRSGLRVRTAGSVAHCPVSV